jgi:hypothetical protein
MLFVFDLDGTIIFRGEPLSKTIAEALVQAEALGHETVFASARPIRDMLPVLDERFHRHLLIGGNGSLVARDGRVVHAETFQPEQLAALLAAIAECGCTYLIDGEWDYAYTGRADHPILRNLDPHRKARNLPVEQLDPIVKICLLSSDMEDELRARLAELDVVIHEHRSENLFDINPPDIHKWSALRKTGVAAGGYVAFGNDANDVTLFRHARHSVMVGHHPDLAPWATESIPPAEEETLAVRVRDKILELAHAFRTAE